MKKILLPILILSCTACGQAPSVSSSSLTISASPSPSASPLPGSNLTQQVIVHLESDVVDATGHTTLTDSGTSADAASTAPGSTGSRHFGGSAYAQFGLSNTLWLSSGDFTVDFYMKTTQTTFARILGDDAADCTGHTIDISLNEGGTGTLTFGLVSSGSHGFVGKTTVNDGTWHHVLAARISGTIELFVDGISQGSVYAPGATPNESNHLTIGRAGDCADHYYSGSLSELIISHD